MGNRAHGTFGKTVTRAGFAGFAAALGICLLGAAPQAQAANLLEKNFWLSGPNFSGKVPSCDEPSALGLIAQRFSETERRFWASDLSISEFGPVKEIAFRPWGPAYVPTRYCSGTVVTSDARKRSIYYSIVEDGGFIGASWGVRWCIAGLDRNYAYAPGCQMARP
ncbi:hypothetical protein ACT6QH_03420 [Xanthobacter sp. TB0139]|uniref:hypothetical protein n=1 Tax=Xanthobacter sp. TB0139 TaxID=3459178 RepID=UPI0040393AA0